MIRGGGRGSGLGLRGVLPASGAGPREERRRVEGAGGAEAAAGGEGERLGMAPLRAGCCGGGFVLGSLGAHSREPPAFRLRRVLTSWGGFAGGAF